MKIFLFPGQGSQSVGMGRELCERSELCRQLYNEADAVLGRPLSKICFEGPEEELRQTTNTQPALYLMSAALVAVLREEGCVADAVAGHSVGEYPALYAAGCCDFATGLRLVQARADAMQAAGEQSPGTMAAVLNLAAEDVADVCAGVAEKLGQPVGVAAINTPVQVVISGTQAAVDAVQAPLKARGARRVVPLNVSAAFHSALMAPAVGQLESALQAAALQPPQARFAANYDASYQSDPDTIRTHLAQQLCHPVRWVESIQLLRQLDAAEFYEIGPGNVVTGMLKKFQPPLGCVPVNTMDAVAQLSRKGVS